MSVDSADVDAVLDSTDIDDFTPFIKPAGRMYDSLVDGEDVDSAVRDDVVTRLAAHFVATGPERQVDSGSESGGSVTFAGDTGMGLRASTHGQIAITLDPTGALASADKPSASLNVPDTKRGGY